MAIRCGLIIEQRPVGIAFPRPKTASGGLRHIPRHRVGRTGPQPTDAPWKNRPRYDGARRGAVLPQKTKPLPPCAQSFLKGRISGDPAKSGSVTAITNGSGDAIVINGYDEYGMPATSNLGRFQYTGQTWIPEFGLYYYKARFYSPTLGRFMQTDPIGYADGINWYAYVGNDPINATDPSGLTVDADEKECQDDCGPIVVTGRRPKEKLGLTPGVQIPKTPILPNNPKIPPKPPQKQKQQAKSKPKPCSGWMKSVADGLYKGGGYANDGATTAGIAGVLSLGTPVTAPMAPFLGGAATIGGIIGTGSQAISGAYYAYNGNWAPLSKTGVGWLLSKINPLPGKDGDVIWGQMTDMNGAQDNPSSCSPE